MNTLQMTLLVITCSLLVLALLLYLISVFLFRSTLRPYPQKKWEPFVRKALESTEGFQTGHERLFITANDGLTLSAYFFRGGDRKIAVLCHGYNGYPTDLWRQLSHFRSQGYSVLLPIARGHGESKWQYIGMGWKERFDLIAWCNELGRRYPDARLLLFGHSMGAATVMMAIGEKSLPTNVACAVEDCGYTSVYEEFAVQLRQQYHLPVFPLLSIAERIARRRMGYGFHEASSLEQIKKSRTPTLFIHGDADDFVPTSMVYPLYEAASSEKELLIVKGAAHVESVTVDPALYFGTIDSFAERYMDVTA